MVTTEPTAIDKVALARAMGLLWAGAVVVLGITARTGWGRQWRDLLADVYVGYDSSDRGLAIGAVWAFADAFVGAYLLGWLYNRFRHPAAPAEEPAPEAEPRRLWKIPL